LWHALMGADLVKLARNELEYLADPMPGGEEAVVQRILEGKARLLVVTDGAATLQWRTREGRGEVPAFRVRAVDTTAAGDAFVGGVLFHLAQRGIDGAGFAQFTSDAAAITEALRFGAAVGALAVTRQGAFAAISCALVVGAIAERAKFAAVLLFAAIWFTFAYLPLAHMVWAGNGYLFGVGALDFAGGTVVHINAGVAGLVGAYMLGPRIGFGRERLSPHNLPLTFVGASLLWVGWFGFNAGSALEANGVAALAFVNTLFAAAAAVLAQVEAA